MIEIIDNIWKYYEQGHWICITTNGFVKNNGECVMGRGIALQCKQKFPEFPKILGNFISENGNIVGVHQKYRIISFPVKHNWWEKGNLGLIEKSAYELSLIGSYIDNIFLTKPGCHNGKLDWKNVKPILEKYLNNNFIICDLN